MRRAAYGFSVRVLGPALAAAATAVLGLPAAAGADVICVGTSGPGCTSTQPGLQEAFDAADNDSLSTTVRLGAGTFKPTTPGAGFTSSDGGEVIIQGSGPGTVITDDTLAPGGKLLLLMAAGQEVHDLTVRLPPDQVEGSSFRYGAYLVGGSMSDVAVEATSATDDNYTAIGVVGAALDDITIDIDGLTHLAAQGIVASGASLITDVAVTCGDQAGRGASLSGPVVLRRARIECGSGVRVFGSAGQASRIETSVIRATGRAATSYGVNVMGASGNGLGIIDALTVVGAGGSSNGLRAEGGGSGTASLSAYSSIVTGFGTDLRATTSSAKGGTISASWSMIDFGSEQADAGSSVGCSACSDEPDAGVGFVSAVDLRLRQTSAAIDAGDQFPAGAVTDFLEGPREIDGDGNGSAYRDIGAYEMPAPTAPSVLAAAPATALVGEVVTFTATGTDVNPGDALSYAWAFDDGGVAPGASVPKSFVIPGSHSATVTATDSTGRTGTGSTTVLVASPPAPAGGGGGGNAPPGATDTTAPGVTALRVTPAKFRLGTSAPAVVAARKPAKPPKQAAIRFTLSETAQVTLGFNRLATGVRSGKACVARGTAKLRRKKCMRKVPVSGAIVLAAAPGRVRVTFAGILDGGVMLRRGRYELAAVAVDSAGNASAPATARFRIA